MYQSNGRISNVTISREAMVDLHMHTTSSDGRYTPAVLAKAAHDAGLAVIALADHDRLDNVRPLQDEAARYGIWVVPAVEVSCTWGKSEAGGTVYHLLVYNADLTDERVAGPLEENKRRYAE